MPDLQLRPAYDCRKVRPPSTAGVECECETGVHLFGGVRTGRRRGADTFRRPVVELFTSEGCSDCPPADAVLAKLSNAIPGVDVIPLEEHVDYWDRQGWRDPFSSASFTLRQVDYTRALRVDSPYTPQMIVNGRDEFVGSSYGTATNAIAKAARGAPRQVRIAIAVDRVSGNVVPVHISAQVPEGLVLKAADVFVAVTENGLSSHVTAGENRGKDLRHSAVVRSLTRIGTLDGKSSTWSGAGDIAIDRQWNPRTTRIVAFVQDHGAGVIHGAATAAVN
jgi:hypothetical protein